MTEAEWLACPYPTRMIEGKRGRRRSTRKLRLLACACSRRVWHLLTDAGRNAVLIAEQHADGGLSNELLNVAQPAFVHGGNVADNGVHFGAAPNRLFRSWVHSAMSFAAWAVSTEGPNHEAEQLAQCQLVRDIFGPLFFRPVNANTSWLTTTVTGLAFRMYECRDFSSMSILADALQDAGCDNEDILSHCQQRGEHVRGCWVVDLLLNKK
jgi:hypothetical protein